MYEFRITNLSTGEEGFVFGYNFKDACRRSNLNSADWIIDWQEYVD